MARLVRHTQMGPYKIDPKTLPQDKMVSICGCGLSRNLPFCDGAHKTCREEAEGQLYVYEADGSVRIVDDEGPKNAADNANSPKPDKATEA